MLELKTYTIDELGEILNTKIDKQQITKKLDRMGVRYSECGRGNTLQFEIQEIKDEFKVFCKYDLGFDPKTDFRRLAYFLYLFFNDEDFQIQPFVEMEKRMEAINRKVAPVTLSKWKRKLQALGLFANSSECRYYVVSHGERKEISHEEYSKAWQKFYAYRDKHINDKDFDSRNAFLIMYASLGGRAIKRPLVDKNDFYSHTIEKIIELSAKVIEDDVNSVQFPADEIHIDLEE